MQALQLVEAKLRAHPKPSASNWQFRAFGRFVLPCKVAPTEEPSPNRLVSEKHAQNAQSFCLRNWKNTGKHCICSDSSDCSKKLAVLSGCHLAPSFRSRTTRWEGTRRAANTSSCENFCLICVFQTSHCFTESKTSLRSLAVSSGLTNCPMNALAKHAIQHANMLSCERPNS